MEELEGRIAANAHRQLVQTSVDGGMNTLRVWGGGMFLPDEWYDACDELGIMVYHDMQYAQGGHAPKNDAVQDAELRHQIRRLSSHASIVLWDGCNECRVLMGTGTGIYATFVMTVVAQEDASRSIWPSCPALGWTGGVDKLTSRPTGTPLTTPKGGFLLETHGPYQHGTGFPAVNGASKFQPVSDHMNAGMPITMPSGKSGTTVGLGKANIFASEFGSSVYSSFESMSPTLAKEHWGMHGGGPPDNCEGGFASKCQGTNVMAQRNYPCDNIIDKYFGLADASAVGELPFKKQLWQCMVGQSLLLKSDIETRRSTNQFGIIVWQLNEIWRECLPAPLA
jgi:beta-mannosidase